MDVLAVFIFIVWFWLLITIFADLFRRHDISGWIKAILVIAAVRRGQASVQGPSSHAAPRLRLQARQ
jgi:hypothetical protein